MSYYYSHEFKFSTHAIQRIRQRLGMPQEEEILLKEKIHKIIDKSTSSFETSKHIYIETNKKQTYLVIDKNTKLIITATPISVTKQLFLIENE